MRTAGSNRLRGELAGNELRTRKEYVSDRDAGFKQPLERCKLLTRWAFEYFDQTSTGLRIHVGNARKPPKQRAWRKLHIAVDRETGNIVASELTASRARDATRVPALLTQIQAPLVSVAADSAYDKEAVYEAIEAHSPGRRTRVVIPPQRNATLSQNSNTAMQERDRHIRAIERHGRREWYKLSGYTKRSMVENAVYRYKALIGPEMRARTLARQRVEHRIGCEILNKMAALGMPDTYCAG